MKEIVSVLEHCPLFSGISPEELPGLLDCLGAQTRPMEKRRPIFSAGQPARYLGVVLEGAVQILQEDYFGGRAVLGAAGPGELFGEAFACAGADSLPVTVLASESGSLLLLDCRRVTGPCEKGCAVHQRLVLNLLQVMAQKNLAFHQKLQILSRRTTREKLLAYLDLQARQHQSASFFIPFDRQALADYLGVERSGLSSEIGRLKAEGVLDCRKNRFTLLEKAP